MRWALRFVPTLVGALLLAQPASAGDIDKARRLFTEAVKRYEDGDFEGARVLFREADAEHHAAAIVYNIARAEEQLAHPQAAVDAYEAYVGEAGDTGEFTQTAIMAIARIKASARQLHIETKPAGARLFVDGALTRDPAPTRILVPAGRHHVVAEGEGWRAEADVDTGAERVLTVTLEPKAPTETTPPPPSAPSTPPPPPPAVATPSVARPEASESSEGLVVGAQLAVVPHRFAETITKPRSSFGLAMGLMLEAGYAPSENLVLLARGLLAIGSKGVPATIIKSVGAGLSYRVHRLVWIGAALEVGRAILPGAHVPAPGEQPRFDTDVVYCPSLEISVALLTKPYGQWLVSVMPGYFLASHPDNEMLSIPVGFGLRTF